MHSITGLEHGPAHRAPHLTGALDWWAAEQPQKRAYVFVDDQGRELRSVSYAELSREVADFCERLRQVASRGDRVLLVFPTCLEFIVAFLSCLRLGVIAVPLSPPKRNRYSQIAARIAADCKPSALLTVSSEVESVRAEFAEVANLQRLPWLIVNEGAASISSVESRVPDPPALEQIAFLQYTSGSTSAPKGVMVSHGNLLANELMIYRAFEHDSNSTVVGWAPFFHDQGLVGNVLHPLYAGTTCILMSPVSFLKRPLIWLNTIARYRAHTSGGPNFAFDFCCRAAEGKDLSGLDLSSWKLAFNGAEPIRAETLQRFNQTFGPYGFSPRTFYPCYGMAEATLFVTGALKSAEPRFAQVSKRALLRGELRESPVDAADAKTLVGSGVVRFGADVAIVDTATLREQPAGREGEIWIAGPNIASGYWQQPEVSQATFGARLIGSERGPFLRSGDLGFRSESGELFVTGRIKDLIIVFGRNHYPQDIEVTSENAHAALRPNGAAAFTIEAESGDQLVLVQEVKRENTRSFALEEVRAAIRRAIAAEHELAVHAIALVRAGTIPKTTSGKVQRRLTRQLYLDGQLELLSGRTEGAHAESNAVQEGVP